MATFPSACPHLDIRKFDGVRCCLACGEASFDERTPAAMVAMNSTDSNVYHYRKLNYRLGLEIRLVELLPGNSGDDIRCDIIHVNLDDDPIYDAVSYTWATETGDTALSGMVRCIRGGLIPITANCEAALRQLRQRGLRRRVWIDALCIDQGNISERNHQVGLMDQIYSRARSVRICIQHSVDRWDRLNYEKLFRWLRGDDVTNIADVEECDDLISSLKGLMSLRYFRRVWVIQEVAKARAAYLMVNSHELLLTPGVMDRLRSLSSHYNYALPGVLTWDPLQHIEADIVTCLRAGFSGNATDERDMVFAVLSLMEPKARKLIPVDYSSSIESVHKNAIIGIIATQKSLAILRYANALDGPTSDGWKYLNLDCERLRHFLGVRSADMVPDPVPKHARALGLAGDLFDQFKEEQVGPWCSTIDAEIIPVDNYQEVRWEDENMSCVFVVPQPLGPGLLPRFRVRAHFIDTILRHNLGLDSIDCGFRWQPEASFLLAVFGTSRYHDLSNLGRSELKQKLSQPDLADLEEFVDMVREHGEHKEQFHTHYSVGFAYPGFRIGDMVFAVDGVRAPLILRHAGRQSYRIISDCYLWSALELDCWNPGTRRGRWGPDVKRPETKQTRMIEIL